jgi:flagellar motor switch protein FliM
MKPERALVAERALAQHCSELIRPAAPPADLLPQVALCGEPLAAAFAAGLAPLLGGEAPAVRAEPPSQFIWGELASTFAPLAANCLFGAGCDDAPLLLSLDAGPVLRMLDLAFGGRGDAPPQLPDALPMSAELMIARLETIITDALRDAFALAEAVGIRPLRRDGNIDLLKPFASDMPVAVLNLTVTETAGASWTAMLAFPLTTLPALLATADGQPREPAAHQGDRTAPFGDMPLSLSAVLVDMAMPVSVIAALEPGAILPVSVARSVPLRIGAQTIAHGTIGALDERVAVQITHAF